MVANAIIAKNSAYRELSLSETAATDRWVRRDFSL